MLAVVGALAHATELYPLAMGMITGALGHAGSGGRASDRILPAPPAGGAP